MAKKVPRCPQCGSTNIEYDRGLWFCHQPREDCGFWGHMPPYFELVLAWYDFWVGFYWDKKNKKLYFFPIPCIGISVQFKFVEHLPSK
jgi:hypothetical protein